MIVDLPELQYYQMGKSVNDQLRYNIDFDKDQIYNITCANYIKSLLDHPYSTGLGLGPTNKLKSLIYQLAK
jgi:hypothetical protein